MCTLEDRKKKEIEHSKIRRSILQGFERVSDSTLNSDQVKNTFVKNQEEFDYHFSNMKYYSVTVSSENYKEEWLKNNIKTGYKLLDFACGSGENSIFSAKYGAISYGIDISPEGILNARNNAEHFKLKDKCFFEVMDGENMNFSDNFFDIAVEYGALHHVDLDIALKEISRVLKPSSKMICVEALRHNPLIHFYRKVTPHLRTEWEVNHILGVESLEVMKKYFKNVNVKFFHLFSLLLVPFRKTFLFKALYPWFNKFDNFILSNKFLGKYSWIMIIELSDPIK